jgi:hypothetical protein
MIIDWINGAFELLGGVLCWMNARRLMRDKQVRGVHWQVTAFFSAWGFWNLFYYPALHQWISFTGGLVLVLGNTCWVVMAIHYRNR